MTGKPHFQHADLVERAEQWANDGKHVLVSALDATFQRKPFLNVLEVISLAENVIKLTAVCSDCHKSASFTKRLSAETDIQVSKALELSIWTICKRLHGLRHLCNMFFTQQQADILDAKVSLAYVGSGRR